MAGIEHVVSMEEFHSRKVIRREAGETSNGAATEDAQTHSNSIHTNTLAERLKMVMEAGKKARNQSSTPNRKQKNYSRNHLARTKELLEIW
jgi:hypothetical protein